MIANRFYLEKVINSGRYGQVYMATNIGNGRYYACKMLPKKRHDLSDFKNKMMIDNEIRNMNKVQVHKNIVRLEEVLEDEENVYLIEELCGGGAYEGGGGGDQHMKGFVGDVIDAVAHCHEQDIIFGDLKLGNIIFSIEDQCYKLTDFGSSVAVDSFSKEGFLKSTTPVIAAPELLTSDVVTFAYDVWGIGILTRYVYQHSSHKRNEDIEEFIRMCLETDPSKRMKSYMMKTYWSQIF